eukprot:g377.t1
MNSLFGHFSSIFSQPTIEEYRVKEIEHLEKSLGKIFTGLSTRLAEEASLPKELKRGYLQTRQKDRVWRLSLVTLTNRFVEVDAYVDGKRKISRPSRIDRGHKFLREDSSIHEISPAHRTSTSSGRKKKKSDHIMRYSFPDENDRLAGRPFPIVWCEAKGSCFFFGSLSGSVVEFCASSREESLEWFECIRDALERRCGHHVDEDHLSATSMTRKKRGSMFGASSRRCVAGAMSASCMEDEFVRVPANAQITRAWFGDPKNVRHGCDVTDIAKRSAKKVRKDASSDLSDLIINATKDLLGDPCKGVRKKLIVYYALPKGYTVRRTHEAVSTFVYEDGKQVKYPFGTIVVSATYGHGKYTVDVTSKLLFLREFVVGPDIFGDPWKGSVKTLRVRVSLPLDVRPPSIGHNSGSSSFKGTSTGGSHRDMEIWKSAQNVGFRILRRIPKSAKKKKDGTVAEKERRGGTQSPTSVEPYEVECWLPLIVPDAAAIRTIRLRIVVPSDFPSKPPQFILCRVPRHSLLHEAVVPRTDPEMWAIASERFSRKPFSNGQDARYEMVKQELRSMWGHDIIGGINKKRLKQIAINRGVDTCRPPIPTEEGWNLNGISPQLRHWGKKRRASLSDIAKQIIRVLTSPKIELKADDPCLAAQYADVNQIVAYVTNCDDGDDVVKQKTVGESPTSKVATTISTTTGSSSTTIPAALSSLWTRDESAGRTALHYAALRGDVKIVGIILTWHSSSRGSGKADSAAASRRSSRKTVDVTQSWSPSSSLAIGGGVKNKSVAGFESQDSKTFRAYVNSKDSNGWTPLHCACYSGNPSVVQMLLDAGADASSVCRSDKTPFDVAQLHGKLEVMRSLLRSGIQYVLLNLLMDEINKLDRMMMIHDILYAPLLKLAKFHAANQKNAPPASIGTSEIEALFRHFSEMWSATDSLVHHLCARMRVWRSGSSVIESRTFALFIEAHRFQTLFDSKLHARRLIVMAWRRREIVPTPLGMNSAYLKKYERSVDFWKPMIDRPASHIVAMNTLMQTLPLNAADSNRGESPSETNAALIHRQIADHVKKYRAAMHQTANELRGELPGWHETFEKRYREYMKDFEGIVPAPCAVVPSEVVASICPSYVDEPYRRILILCEGARGIPILSKHQNPYCRIQLRSNTLGADFIQFGPASDKSVTTSWTPDATNPTWNHVSVWNLRTAVTAHSIAAEVRTSGLLFGDSSIARIRPISVAQLFRVKSMNGWVQVKCPLIMKKAHASGVLKDFPSRSLGMSDSDIVGGVKRDDLVTAGHLLLNICVDMDGRSRALRETLTRVPCETFAVAPGEEHTSSFTTSSKLSHATAFEKNNDVGEIISPEFAVAHPPLCEETSSVVLAPSQREGGDIKNGGGKASKLLGLKLDASNPDDLFAPGVAGCLAIDSKVSSPPTTSIIAVWAFESSSEVHGEILLSSRMPPLSIGHVEGAFGTSDWIQEYSSSSAPPMTVNGSKIHWHSDNRIKTSHISRRAVFTTRERWRASMGACTRKFASQLPFVWPKTLFMRRGPDRNTFRACMPPVSPASLLSLSGDVHTLRSAISLPGEMDLSKATEPFRWSVKIDRVGFGGVRVGVCTANASLQKPLGIVSPSSSSSNDWSIAFCSDGMCISGGLYVKPRSPSNAPRLDHSNSRETSYERSMMFPNSRVVVQYDYHPQEGPRLVVELNGRRLNRPMYLRKFWKHHLNGLGAGGGGGQNGNGKIVLPRLYVAFSLSPGSQMTLSGESSLFHVPVVPDIPQGISSKNNAVVVAENLRLAASKLVVVNVSRGRPVESSSMSKRKEAANLVDGELDTAYEFTFEEAEYDRQPWICVSLETVHSLEAVHMLWGGEMPDRVRVEVNDSEDKDSGWTVVSEIDLRSRSGDTGSAKKWVKTELPNGSTGKFVRIRPLMQRRRLARGLRTARLLLTEVYALTKVDSEMLLSSDQSLSSATTPLLTPSVKMLDHRSVKENLARAFMRVERGVVCAESQTDLRKVMHVFADFCSQHPLRLRSRSFVPWRQVVADICREKVILNGTLVTDHCVSTGDGIVILERALRKSVRPFLKSVELDPLAAEYPRDEACPSWWGAVEIESAKRVRRPSAVSAATKTSSHLKTDEKKSETLLEAVVKRVSLWILQALDRTGAADAWQVLYDTLNPRSPRVLLPPSHDIENAPVQVTIDATGVVVKIFANYDCFIPSSCAQPTSANDAAKKKSVHLAVLTEIEEKFHFSDLEITKVDRRKRRRSSVSVNARRMAIDLTGVSGSGRTMKLSMSSSGFSPTNVHHSLSSKSNILESSYLPDSIQELTDTLESTFDDAMSIIGTSLSIGGPFSSNATSTNVGRTEVRTRSLNVGVPLFRKGAKGIERRSIVKALPRFLFGASTIEFTSKECSSRAKELVKVAVQHRSVVYLLVAREDKTSTSVRPTWLSDGYFLRDERVFLAQPIGVGGVEIWQSESEMDPESDLSIPGLGGYGGPLVKYMIPLKNHVARGPRTGQKTPRAAERFRLFCASDECPNRCHEDDGKGRCELASDAAVATLEATRGKFSCACSVGWKGADCSEDKRCPKGGPIDEKHACNGHGACSAESCKCEDGWTGTWCDEMTCPDDCSGHGLCDATDGRCVCEEGFFGDECADEFRCTGECSGNGACVGVEKCECFEGYGGDRCEKSNCVTKKGEGPKCSGHGACDPESGDCACEPGYGGFSCDQSCPGLCKDAEGKVRGVCETNEASVARCKCEPGFVGIDCSVEETCPSSSSSDATCSGHGHCALGRCACQPGWDGDACDEQHGCPEGCNEPHGKCGVGQCHCSPGFEGSSCDTEIECDCSGHGICSRGKCFCDPNWTGDDCRAFLASDGCDCNGRGFCNRGKCVCNTGWAGRSCEQIVSPLKEMLPQCDADCSAHGKCDLGTCNCDAGWRGQNCDREDVGACPEDCSGHGACKFDICWCVPGFSGDDCGIEDTCSAEGEGDAGALQALIELRAHVRKLTTPPKAGGDFSIDNDKVITKRTSVQKSSPSGTKLTATATTLATKVSPHRTVTQVHAALKTADGIVAHATASSTASATPTLAISTANAVAGTMGSIPTIISTADDLPFSSGCSGHGVCSLGRCFCHPSFHGDSCESRYDCEHDCSERGMCVGGKCLCIPGFGGKDCSQLTEGSDICPDDCSKHGRCELGKCFCFDGYTGRACEKASKKSCPNDCFHQGECDAKTGLCFCSPGFTGVDCGTIAECPVGCEEHGVCKYGTCYCALGWTGKGCSVSETSSSRARGKAPATRQCQNACSEHGICHEGACHCEPGYGGPSCATVLIGAEDCPNDCRGSSSQGTDGKLAPKRGVCVLGRCFCDPEYEGHDCGRHNPIPCPSGDCGSHGTCRLGKCFCESGWDGDACDRRKVEKCAKKCSGNGICRDSKCACAPGFFGAACDQVGKEPCASCVHGRCLFGQCVCDDHWSGSDCSTNLLQPPVVSADDASTARFMQASVQIGAPRDDNENATAPAVGLNCSGNGIFVPETDKCWCFPGFSGNDCGDAKLCGALDGLPPANSDDDGCGSHGMCANGRCVCDEGWTGPQCLDSSVIPCPSNCSGNGVCRQGRCWCDSPFVGVDCADAPCPDNCNMRGICSNGQCYCVDGFTGPNCVPIAVAAAQARDGGLGALSTLGAEADASNGDDADETESRSSSSLGMVIFATCVVVGAIVALLYGMVSKYGKVWQQVQQKRQDDRHLVGSELGETTTAAIPFLGKAP